MVLPINLGSVYSPINFLAFPRRGPITIIVDELAMEPNVNEYDFNGKTNQGRRPLYTSHTRLRHSGVKYDERGRVVRHVSDDSESHIDVET